MTKHLSTRVRAINIRARWRLAAFGLLLAALALPALVQVQRAAAVPDAWSAAGSLTTSRYQHTATLLSNGKVLVAGGYNGATLASAELYDPSTNTWSPAGSMATGRYRHTATLLSSGKVLVAGGVGAGYLASAELYDPVANTWSATAGPMAAARESHTAVLLANGKVIVAGGSNGVAALASAELYDPVANTWSAGGSLTFGRSSHTATLLPNGMVFVAGGQNFVGDLASAELYNPGTNIWSTAASLTTARRLHTATLLPNGKVLVIGGFNGGTSLATGQLYDSVANTWSAAGSLATGRTQHSATLLPNGKVLAAGGYNSGSDLASAELYDSTANTWSAAGGMTAGRSQQRATLLATGKVLAVAGSNAGLAVASAELYDPTPPPTNTWSPAGSMAIGRAIHTATLLPSGKVLVAGGHAGGAPFASAALYDPITNTWSVAGSMAGARMAHTATLLPNGKVLVAGGIAGVALATAELYDPVANTWSTAGSMTGARFYHSATLLPNGKVLIAAGDSGAGYLTSAQLYDPSLNTWSAAGSLTTARRYHTATLLGNGKVLVAAGAGSPVFLASAELYDPGPNTWSAAGSMATARAYHTAALLPDGRVLAAGGQGAAPYLASAELYDPVANTWSAAGTMAATRGFHTATLLPNGKVLVAAGFSGAVVLATAELYDSIANVWTAAGSLTTARYSHTATLLTNGKVLAAGGADTGGGYLASAELYDPVPLLLATVASQVHNAAHADITNTTVSTGTVVHDRAAVTGAGPTPVGTVDFTRYTTADCTGASSAENNVVLAGGIVESATHVTVNGTLSYKVHYDGDGTYASADGPCEPLLVTTAGGFPGKGDDVFRSMGTFKILVAAPFQPMLQTCPIYNTTTAKIQSPLLFDPTTKIGRSDVLTEGSVEDSGGVPVGTADVPVSDADMPLRPAQFDGPASPRREVHTEIHTLNLQGFGAYVRAGTMAPLRPTSAGEVQSKDNTGTVALDFPAESFFNVFVEAKIPQCGAATQDIVLYNLDTDPLLVENDNLTMFPPKVVYIHGNTNAVEVHFLSTNPGQWVAGDLFGWLILAGHGAGFDPSNPADVNEFTGIINPLPDMCAGTDGDCDGYVGPAATSHQGPRNTNPAVDNCPSAANADQLNSDANYVDHSPPFSPAVDDKTWPNSDALGDACDPDDDNDGRLDADESLDANADGDFLDAGDVLVYPVPGCAVATLPINRLLRDTDGDRVLDGAECARGTNPTSAASKPTTAQCGPAGDTDGDRLLDRVENCNYGTNPANTDSDGDKALDGGIDGCEATSFNPDRIVNIADQGLLAQAIAGGPSWYHPNVDVNKDGALNIADTGTVASFRSPSGQCPG